MNATDLPPIRTHGKAGSHRLRVAILYQLPESWCNVRSVWQSMQADPTIDCTVLLLPFLHSDYRWDRRAAEQYLKDNRIPWTAWDTLDFANAGFDAVLFTSPYDGTRPPEYHFQAIRRHAGFIGYIPYCMEVGGGDINIANQYRQPLESNASAVFVRSERERARYAKHCPSGDSHVVVTGHPRMDAIFDLDRFPIDKKILADIDGRKAILWNPHFSFDADMWSTFDVFALPILEAFSRRPHLALLFRPHPLLWKKLVNVGIFDEAGITAFCNELRKLGVVIDRNPDHRHSFAASHAMLSDASTMLTEYFATSKPVLYLHNPHGLGLNEEGEAVVDYYKTANHVEDIGAFLDDLDQSDEAGAMRRKAAIPKFFARWDGHAGQRVTKHIKAALGA